MLDLEVWMALQNVVEILHLYKRIEPKALWNGGGVEEVGFHQVAECLQPLENGT